MIRKEAHLAENLFAADIAQKPTRDGYGEGVVLAAEKHPEVVVVCADLTDSTRNGTFKKKFPERFVQVGVHEQCLTAGFFFAASTTPEPYPSRVGFWAMSAAKRFSTSFASFLIPR